MVWGQSNGTGVAPGELPAEYADPVPDARYWHHMHGIATPSESWGELYPVPGGRGVELVIGRADHWVVKHTRSGTTFNSGWRPGTGYNWKQAEITTDAAIAAGPGFGQRTLVWIHGESDSSDPTWATAYEGHLHDMRTVAQARYGSDLRFVVCMLHDQSAYQPGRYIVRAAQEAFAAAHDDVVKVETNALSLHDSVHYTLASQMRLGEAVLAAMQTWQDTVAQPE